MIRKDPIMLQATFDTVARGGGDGPRFIFPLLLLVLLGFGIAALIRRRRGGGPAFRHHHGPGSGSPMQTLEDRFARGDIDRAEFEHRKAVLIGAETVPPAPASAPPTPPTQPDPVVEPTVDEDDA